jgi:putative membrane protein
MILPGISGSLLLVILGMYAYMSTVLSTFTGGLAGLLTGGSSAVVVESGTVVAVFMLGGLTGLFTVSRLVRRALDWNRRATLAFLVALVVGALRAPVAELRGDPAIAFADVVGVFAAAAVVGAVLVLVLDYYAVDIDLEADV